MIEQSPTLRRIFNLSVDEATQGIVAAVDASLWQRVGIPTRLRTSAARKIAMTLDAFLSTSVLGLVRTALQSHGGLARYADDRDHRIDKLELSIESDHEPYVDLRMKGFKPQRLRFPLVVSLQFSGATLLVSGNRVMALKTGRCVAAGTLCCENTEIFTREATPFKMPGELQFGDGIPIGTLSHRT